MAQTFNEELLDAIIRHQVALLQFAGGLRNRIWRLLDATENDLRRQVLRYEGAGLDTPGGLRQLEFMLAALRKTRLRGWKDARATWFEEARALAREEPGYLDRVFASIFPVELGTQLPNAAVLRDIVTSSPFMGKTLRQWADKVQADDLARIESAVKIGLVQGEALPQLARRLVGTKALKGRDGVTQATRRELAMLVRTINSGIANEARRAYLEANADLVSGVVFIATLDSRTTPICRSLDGNVYQVDDAPVLPLHFGERSILGPAVDGEVIGERPRRDFTQRQLLREWADAQGYNRPPLTRAALPHGAKGAFDAWARGRMRELTGRTPARTTYGQWLKRQSAAFQDDILGPTRGALFRRGGLTLDKFVERDGSELTLAELARRHESAFLAANLDPSAYRAA